MLQNSFYIKVIRSSLQSVRFDLAPKTQVENFERFSSDTIPTGSLTVWYGILIKPIVWYGIVIKLTVWYGILIKPTVWYGILIKEQYGTVF